VATVPSFLIYVLWKTAFQVVYTRLPAIVCSILNAVDTVRTVKVLYSTSVSVFIGCVYPYIDGIPVVYTVSVVDLSLHAGCLCASACAQNS
jgi:hypothetical protein